MAFHPDLVIIHYVGNDLALPDFIARRDGRDYFSMTRSFLAELLSTRLSDTEAEDAPEPLRPAPRRVDARGFEEDPARVPPEYRQMVGVDGYRTAMRRLGQLGGEHHFRVLVTVQGRIPDFVSEICAELGFSLLEILPEVERYMREHGIDQYRGSELTVSKSDRHPSVVQHRLIAQVIYRHMLETRMVQPR